MLVPNLMIRSLDPGCACYGMVLVVVVYLYKVVSRLVKVLPHRRNTVMKERYYASTCSIASPLPVDRNYTIVKQCPPVDVL